MSWLTTAIVVGVFVWQERSESIERARLHMEALALVLESHSARTLQAVDVTLSGVAEALRLSPQVPNNDPELQAAMTRRVDELQPYVRAIFVIGPDGWITHDTDYPHTPRVPLGDRAYFLRHRQDPSLVRSVSVPLESRSGLGWFLAVTRRLGRGDTFDGVIVAAVQPRYFESLYRRMGLGEAEIISLFHAQGVLISQYPGGSDAIGTSFARSPLFADHLPRHPAASYVTGRGLLPSDSMVSYRSVQMRPLVVALTRPMRTILGPWRRTAFAAALALVGLLVLLGVLVTLLRRQQRVRERVREQREQTERLEALGQLTGGIAHDFNNLLGVVSTSLALLRRDAVPAEPRQQALAAADRSVVHGSELVRRLSTFARRQEMRIHAVDLSACVQGSSELLRQAAGSDIDLRTVLADDLAPCQVDETELGIALVNLVLNAKDAIDGTGSIVVRTYDCSAEEASRYHRRSSSGFVCLSVEDDGRGMSREVRKHAFDPYYTTKGDNGTGLGLAQVYGFATQIGGSAHIESRPGSGTRVVLLFPKA